jgi:hypothetical protein
MIDLEHTFCLALPLERHATTVLVGAFLQKLQVIATYAWFRNAEYYGIQVPSHLVTTHSVSEFLASMKEIQGRRRPVESFLKIWPTLEVNTDWPIAGL